MNPVKSDSSGSELQNKLRMRINGLENATHHTSEALGRPLDPWKS